MEILEKIGDAASKTCKYTAEKTAKIAKETKLKMKISECKREIEKIYREIGETVYEKSVVDQDIDKEEIKEKCDKIDELTGKIVECKNEILSLKERKQCRNCYEEIEKDAKYCPNCGCHQEEVKDEEKVEIEIEEEKEEEKKEEGKPEEKKQEKKKKKTENPEEE